MELASLKSWADDNAGLIAFAALLVTVLSVTAAFIRWSIGRKRAGQCLVREQLDNTEKWREEFSDHLAEMHARKPRGDLDDVVILDTARIKKYPERCQDGGIASYFKVWLVDLYHSGILVHFGPSGITYVKSIEDDRNWYYCDQNDPEGKKVHLIGKIPFDRIEQVNWQGVPEYNCPHVFCRFDSKTREPYDELVYCERMDLADSRAWPYFSEVVRLQDMRNNRIC